MDSLIYLAARYVMHHWVKSLILVLCVTLSILLPLSGRAVLSNIQQELQARADSTPIVIGAKGSRYDLTLHSLYFDIQLPETIPFSVDRFVRDTDRAWAIPIYCRHSSEKNTPIVGTTLSYFEFRRLEFRAGDRFTRIGQCVIGANVAQQLKKSVGDFLISTPETDINIAGMTPVKLEIVGILSGTGTNDDDVIFTDLKTTWIIDGLGHGHQDVEQEHDPNLFLEKDKTSATVNRGVVPYIEISDENIGSFHFHGSFEDFPITAVICDPNDAKDATLLQGEVADAELQVQFTEPPGVIQQLMGKIIRIKALFDVAAVALLVVTLLFLVLNTLLSLRLRSREMVTMYKIGCGRFAILGLYAWEYLIVLLVSLLVALLSNAGLAGSLEAFVLETIR